MYKTMYSFSVHFLFCRLLSFAKHTHAQTFIYSLHATFPATLSNSVWICATDWGEWKQRSPLCSVAGGWRAPPLCNTPTHILKGKQMAHAFHLPVITQGDPPERPTSTTLWNKGATGATKGHNPKLKVILKKVFSCCMGDFKTFTNSLKSFT